MRDMERLREPSGKASAWQLISKGQAVTSRRITSKMKIFQIESGNMYEIREHGSANVFLSSVVDIDRSTTIHWMHFDPRGTIGGHHLTSPQIFLIVEGEGWVKSNHPEPIPVRMGDGVFWDTGEWHEAGSESGMAVIFIESKRPDPAAFVARF